MAARTAKVARHDAAAELGGDKGERTRKLIKTTIARLAARKEVSEINLAEICKAARLTTGALYFHFKGKDEAIEEMVIDEVGTLYAGYAQDTADLPFDEAIGAILDRSTHIHNTMKRLPRAIQVVINTRPKAYEAWINARRPLIAQLETTIAQARMAKGLSAEAAPYLAHFILNSIEDLAMDVYQWNNPTLAPFARTPGEWSGRQRALWSWAILAPFPDNLTQRS